MLGSISISVVINNPQSVSKFLGVYLWVEGVTGGAEDGELGAICSCVLLSS